MRDGFRPDVDLTGRIGELEFQSVGCAHLPQTGIRIHVTVELVAFDGLRAGSRRIHRLEHGIQSHALMSEPMTVLAVPLTVR